MGVRGGTFRPIDLNVLVKGILFLDKRFTHGMSTESEQCRMTAHLMTVRFQSHTLRTIPFLSLVAAFRLIATFIETCKSRRRGDFLPNRRRRSFIWSSYRGRGYSTILSWDEWVLASEFRIIRRRGLCCFLDRFDC